MKDYTNGKKVMHIDTSHKLYERNDTGIAYKIIRTKEHKGLAISLKLKEELEKKLSAEYDRARIYAICIYFLIKDDLHLFDELIICGDEDFFSVKKYLILLFQDNRNFFSKSIKSVCQLRVETGDKNLKSYADDIAYSYMKRALRSIVRRQKGVPLNVIKITYEMFCNKWMEIEEKMKKNRGGE
jgi:hypothetical protein